MWFFSSATRISCQPLGAVRGLGVQAQHAELAAINREVVQGGPFCREVNHVLDARGIPATFAVFIEKKLAGQGRFLGELRRDGFGGRG